MRLSKSFASRYCAMIVVIGVSMPVFGSPVLAQQAATTGPGWLGRLEWKAHQNGPSGSTGDFWGHMDLVLTDDGRGKLVGHLVGEQNQKTDGPCTSESVTPGRLNARLVGSYTPSTKAMSIQMTDAQFTPPVIGPCQQYAGRPFAAPSVHTWPQFDRALSSLEPLPDGGFRSNGNWPFPQGTTQYSLTLRRDCLDPAARSAENTHDPFGSETPADIAPTCETCPGGIWKLNIGELKWLSSQREEPMNTPRDSWLCSALLWVMFQNDAICLAKKTIPSCVYTYQAIWTCTATGQVRKTTKSKIDDNNNCQPRG
jgi:hypothetical protein